MITCYECGTSQNGEPADDCGNCGERVGVTCRDCIVLFAVNDLDTDRRCDRCVEDNERAREIDRREQRYDDLAGHGDFLRDEGKDRRPW